MSHEAVAPKAFGVAAAFDSPEGLLAATQRARDAGYRDMDAYTPIPVEGLVEALGFDDVRVAWITFLMGVVGCLSGIALEIWSSKIAYAHNVGGKPLVSWPMFFPVMYECTILFAAFGATFGMLGLNGLPKPHQHVFNANLMNRASQDRFVLCIEARDPNWDEREVKAFLEAQGAEEVETVMESEGY